MSWLERAKREISESAGGGTANSAERNLTAVTAVRADALPASNGTIGSTPRGFLPKIEGATADALPGTSRRVAEAVAALWQDWEERAAIMEHDGGMSREEAEDAAWQRVVLEGQPVPQPDVHEALLLRWLAYREAIAERMLTPADGDGIERGEL